ncbi:MAG: TVP38/TMEM64 family protein [Porticoccaceae bacterium]
MTDCHKSRVNLIPHFIGLFLVCFCSQVIAQDAQPLEALRGFLLSEDSNTALFIVLLLFLPLIGAPITLFCLIAGSKLGVGWGTLAIAIGMLWHLTLCYWLMQSFFKRWILDFIQNRFQTVPEFSADRQLTYCVGLMAIPVLPYMVKNIVVANAHFTFPRYLLITWPIQILYSLPFITLTGAVHRNNYHLIWLAALGFIAVWFSVRWFQKRMRDAYQKEGNS